MYICNGICKGHHSKSTGHHSNCSGCRGVFWGLGILKAIICFSLIGTTDWASSSVGPATVQTPWEGYQTPPGTETCSLPQRMGRSHVLDPRQGQWKDFLNIWIFFFSGFKVFFNLSKWRYIKIHCIVLHWNDLTFCAIATEMEIVYKWVFFSSYKTNTYFSRKSVLENF